MAGFADLPSVTGVNTIKEVMVLRAQFSDASTIS